jgi:hypothetical protein
MMALRLIEPERPSFDLRTFECPKCLGTEALVVSISCEVKVSIAPARSRAQATNAFGIGINGNTAASIAMTLRASLRRCARTGRARTFGVNPGRPLAGKRLLSSRQTGFSTGD